MSYVISRDNPALAAIDAATWARLDKLVDEADESSYPGQHADACGCTDPKCLILDRILIGNGASSLEVLGFAFAKGLLRLDAQPQTEHRLAIERPIPGSVAYAGTCSCGNWSADLYDPADITTHWLANHLGGAS
jgi:hypothetical protein